MVVGVLALGMLTMGRSQPRLQTDFRNRIDSLRLKGMPQRTLDEMVKLNGQQRHPSPRNVVSPQSHIYVVDTATVRSTYDTARYLYSFNDNAKRLSCVSQKLKSGMWVDTLRHTNAYDQNNNVLLDLRESWEGQWIGVNRIQYEYDTYGNVISELHEGWESGQWIGRTRYTATYDAMGNQTYYLDETWLDVLVEANIHV